MDNLTHSLFGATLARTALGRAGRGTTAALILASNAPDVDIVATAGGTLKYLEWHRGPTHGPLGVIGLGLATAGIVWMARKVLDRKHAHEYRSFAGLALVAMVGVLCHVAMDLPTSYGTRLLSPFDWHWFAVDWMPIVDLYLLVALGTGLVFGRGSDGARRRNAAIVIAFMLTNYGFRAYAHARAVALAPRAFGPLLPPPCDPARPRVWIDRWPLDGTVGWVADEDTGGGRTRCLVDVAAFPDFISPFRWRVLLHTSNSYEVRDVDVLDPRLRTAPGPGDAPWRLAMHVPNRWTPAVHTAAITDVGRTFLGFSRFPAARASAARDGVTTVRWDDLRFTPRPRPRPQNDPRGSFFSATVRIGSDGSVLDQTLGP